MSAYNTIPQTTHDAEETLLQAQKPKTNLKALVGGAVAASFVLGVLAATAVSSAVAPRTSNLVASSSGFETNIATNAVNDISGLKGLGIVGELSAGTLDQVITASKKVTSACKPACVDIYPPFPMWCATCLQEHGVTLAPVRQGN